LKKMLEDEEGPHFISSRERYEEEKRLYETLKRKRKQLEIKTIKEVEPAADMGAGAGNPQEDPCGQSGVRLFAF